MKRRELSLQKKVKKAGLKIIPGSIKISGPTTEEEKAVFRQMIEDAKRSEELPPNYREIGFGLGILYI